MASALAAQPCGEGALQRVDGIVVDAFARPPSSGPHGGGAPPPGSDADFTGGAAGQCTEGGAPQSAPIQEECESKLNPTDALPGALNECLATVPEKGATCKGATNSDHPRALALGARSGVKQPESYSCEIFEEVNLNGEQGSYAILPPNEADSPHSVQRPDPTFDGLGPIPGSSSLVEEYDRHVQVREYELDFAATAAAADAAFDEALNNNKVGAEVTNDVPKGLPASGLRQAPSASDMLFEADHAAAAGPICGKRLAPADAAYCDPAGEAGQADDAAARSPSEQPQLDPECPGAPAPAAAAAERPSKKPKAYPCSPAARSATRSAASAASTPPVAALAREEHNSQAKAANRRTKKGSKTTAKWTIEKAAKKRSTKGTKRKDTPSNERAGIPDTTSPPSSSPPPLLLTTMTPPPTPPLLDPSALEEDDGGKALRVLKAVIAGASGRFIKDNQLWLTFDFLVLVNLFWGACRVGYIRKLTLETFLFGRPRDKGLAGTSTAKSQPAGTANLFGRPRDKGEKRQKEKKGWLARNGYTKAMYDDNVVIHDDAHVRRLQARAQAEFTVIRARDNNPAFQWWCLAKTLLGPAHAGPYNEAWGPKPDNKNENAFPKSVFRTLEQAGIMPFGDLPGGCKRNFFWTDYKKQVKKQVKKEVVVLFQPNGQNAAVYDREFDYARAEDV